MYYSEYVLQVLVFTTMSSIIVAQYHPDWDAKVDKQLQEDLKAGKSVNVFLQYTSQSENLQYVAKNYGNNSTPQELADECYVEMSYLTVKDQLSTTNALRDLEFSDNIKVKFDSLWYTNRLYVENCNLKIANIMLKEGKKLLWMESATKYPNFKLLQPSDFTKQEDVDGLTWGLNKIEIEKAWNLVGGAENAGKGARVGIINTGFDKNSALINSSYDPRYGFFITEVDRRKVVDLGGQGTHVTGTIVGKNGIGVAPGAEFLSCAACDAENGCSRYNIEKCFDFLFCPYAHSITLKGCGRVVDVVHISFGTYETTPPPWFDALMEAWTVVKIIPVVAAGNGGQKCKSIAYPGSRQDVLTVGSSCENDRASEFTSFGPVEGNKYLKPDIVAPGTNIKSAGIQNKYVLSNGPASAAAHVTGLIAILRGKQRNISFEHVRSIISDNTDFLHPRTNLKCDGLTDDDKPNYSFGHGRINAYKTVAALK